MKIALHNENVSDEEISTIIKAESDRLRVGFLSSKLGSFETKLIIQDHYAQRRLEIGFGNPMCPKCHKENVRFFSWGAGCKDQTSCCFRIPRTISYKQLSDKQLRDLINLETTEVISAFKDSHGENFKARLKLDEKLTILYIVEQQTSMQGVG